MIAGTWHGKLDESIYPNSRRYSFSRSSTSHHEGYTRTLLADSGCSPERHGFVQGECFRIVRSLLILQLSQLQEAVVDTNGQVETDTNGVLVNTSNSLRAGPRGYVLLEDTAVRKKLIHFDRERAPERVVHALGTGAYGMFESYGDWSNITSACWLQNGAVSETFTRLSVVVASTGGSESARDTHGFATKIYSSCGNQDLVVSFFCFAIRC